MPHPKLDAFLAMLEDVRPIPGGHRARCPVHKGGNERNPSLYIKEGDKGIVFDCKSHGCTPKEVCAAVGWQVSDLFWESKNGQSPYRLPASPKKRFVESPAHRQDLPPLAIGGERKVAEHVYQEADGSPIVKVVRFHTPDPQKPKGYSKRCMPYVFEAGAWKASKEQYGGREVPLYHLPQLTGAGKGALVAWVEGENKADALERLGILATTAIGGTGRKKKLPDLSPLLGKKVCILPDLDRPGIEYAEHVKAALKELGVKTWVLTEYPDEPEPFESYDVVNWLEHHEKADLLPAMAPPLRKPTFKVLSVRQLLAEPRSAWQIVDVIQDDGLWLLFGESSHGKSFIAMDMLMALAAGGLWCGKEVRKGGPVVFVNADGGRAFGDRVDAWFTANQSPPGRPFYTINAAVPIFDPGMVEELIADLDELEIKPVAFCLDTYSRCLAGVDENSQGAISATIRNMDRLRDVFSCSVGTLHHTDSTGRRPRGSTVLIGAVDSAWRVTRSLKQIDMTCYKQRNGADDVEGFKFQLKHVPSTSQVALFSLGAGERMLESARQENRFVVFVSEHANCTAAEIQEALGLSQQRVSEIAGLLMKQAIIEAGPSRQGSTGAPAKTIRMKEDEWP